MNNYFDVIVVGGGPAGMIAAGTAQKRGKSVLLIEKNNKLGKKLLITGKGRCNLTNNADISEFFDQIPRNPSFLYSAFYTFTNQDLISLIESLSVKTKVERGERVFPVSDKAADIVNAMQKYCQDVKIIFGEVTEIIKKDTIISGVILKSGEHIECEKVILATGGASYPLTGSTGDGYKFAKKLGHSVTALTPSLVPLCSDDSFIPSLQGLSLRNVNVSLIQNGKVRFSEFGEMLFTHYGVSGPVILTLSSHMKEHKDTFISIDLKPALNFDQLNLRLLRDFEKYANKDFNNALHDLLPSLLIPVIIKLSGILEHTKVHQITKQQRLDLVRLLKDLKVHITGKRPLSEAIVTSGGICVNEINPSTMESKIIKNLYFAGEIIDVDGYTGGFNLQIAFSTGYLAGISI